MNLTRFCQHLISVCPSKSEGKGPWGQGLQSRAELNAFLCGRPGALTSHLYCDWFINKQNILNNILTTYINEALFSPRSTRQVALIRKLIRWDLACSILKRHCRSFFIGSAICFLISWFMFCSQGFLSFLQSLFFQPASHLLLSIFSPNPVSDFAGDYIIILQKGCLASNKDSLWCNRCYLVSRI